MDAIEVEKLNQLISRTDISGNNKVRWLTDFIDGREFEQQERSYSEEDIREAYMVGKHGGKTQTYYEFKEWFEQFKTK